LQIEVSRPLDTSEFLKTFPYEVPTKDWASTSPYTLPYTYSGIDGDTQTLFVTQQERLGGLCETQLEWDLLLGKLIELAEHENIRGDIISVPLSLYDPLAAAPYSVDAANEVAAQIRDTIESELESNPSIQYIVLVGSDDIITHRRVLDKTVTGNERLYAMSSFLKPGSPLFSSVVEGFILTDDYYGDLQYMSAQEQSLYIPDLAVSRLVETPEEIRAVAQAFIDSDGILDPQTALVTGYDFFDTGAEIVAEILRNAIGEPDTLINDFWTADDLRSEFLGESNDISNPNAHYTHYAALSAYGFANEVDDILSSEEVANLDNDLLENSINFTIGCHAGLNVPDQAAPESADFGLGINPALDFPQALAGQGAILLASSGFGYGDDDEDVAAGTERLMGVFAEDLLQEDTTVGGALVTAKQRYLSSLMVINEYELKSSIQFMLYGLPQYSIGAQLTSSESTTQSTTAQVIENDASLLLEIKDGLDVTTTSHVLHRVLTDNGDYFTADGDAQAITFRPVQPRVVRDVTQDEAQAVHGVLLLGGQFIDEPGFDPVITHTTYAWGDREREEQQVSLDAFWPAQLAIVNTLETGDGLIQTLVVSAGQFRSTGLNSDGDVEGIQRLYTNLRFQLLRPDPESDPSVLEDYQPPTVNSIDLSLAEDGTINVAVEASDASGTSRIVVLTLNGGINSKSWYPGDPWPINVPDQIVIQVVDGAGNVATLTGKGANMRVIPVDVGPDRSFCVNSPTTLTATIGNFNPLLSPYFFAWDFGDGTTQTGLVDSATFSVQHTYSDSAPLLVAASLKVTDANGGIGVDEVVLQQIWDVEGDSIGTAGVSLPDADLIGGCVSNDADTMSIVLRVAGEITDEYKYRVKLYTENGDVYHLQYNDGQVTGLAGLQAVPGVGAITFTFSLADIGLGSGDYIQWESEIQAGVKAAGATGKVDYMPDDGTFGYLLS
jgi:hypothetical protein